MKRKSTVVVAAFLCNDDGSSVYRSGPGMYYEMLQASKRCCVDMHRFPAVFICSIRAGHVEASTLCATLNRERARYLSLVTCYRSGWSAFIDLLGNAGKKTSSSLAIGKACPKFDARLKHAITSYVAAKVVFRIINFSWSCVAEPRTPDFYYCIHSEQRSALHYRKTTS